jgi:hypothetical protein
LYAEDNTILVTRVQFFAIEVSHPFLFFSFLFFISLAREKKRDIGNGTEMNSADPRSHVIELESTTKSTMKHKQRRVRHNGL